MWYVFECSDNVLKHVSKCRSHSCSTCVYVCKKTLWKVTFKRSKWICKRKTHWFLAFIFHYYPKNMCFLTMLNSKLKINSKETDVRSIGSPFMSNTILPRHRVVVTGYFDFSWWWHLKRFKKILLPKFVLLFPIKSSEESQQCKSSALGIRCFIVLPRYKPYFPSF